MRSAALIFFPRTVRGFSLCTLRVNCLYSDGISPFTPFSPRIRRKMPSMSISQR